MKQEGGKPRNGGGCKKFHFECKHTNHAKAGDGERRRAQIPKALQGREGATDNSPKTPAVAARPDYFPHLCMAEENEPSMDSTSKLALQSPVYSRLPSSKEECRRDALTADAVLPHFTFDPRHERLHPRPHRRPESPPATPAPAERRCQNDVDMPKVATCKQTICKCLMGDKCPIISVILVSSLTMPMTSQCPWSFERTTGDPESPLHVVLEPDSSPPTTNTRSGMYSAVPACFESFMNLKQALKYRSSVVTLNLDKTRLTRSFQLYHNVNSI